MEVTIENQPTIFLITTFERCEPGEFGPIFGDVQPVGYRFNFELADAAVQTNKCDIWEGSYDYACIEEYGPYLYPDCIDRWLYKYNRGTGKYESILIPEWMEYIGNIGMIG